MNDMFNQQNENIFNTTRDENIDLTSFFSNNQAAAQNNNPQTITNTPNGELNPQEKKMSPLEAELQRKKDSAGLILSNEDIERGKEQTEFRSAVDSDERVKAYNDAIDENEELIRQRAACVTLRPAQNAQEFSQIIDEISRVKFDDLTGKAYYDYPTDEDGNKIQPVWIRLRTEDDPPFGSGISDNEIINGSDDDIDEDDDDEVEDDSDEDEMEDDDEEEDSDEETTSAKSSAKKKVVQVIIDKTGFGSDASFTAEERAKMSESSEIRLKEVEILDLETITVRRPGKRDGYPEHIYDHELHGPRTTISFPGSGFKADVSGLTYGEIGDITLSMDTITADKYRKRLSTIYNKLCNISSGPFESFDDFLKNLAYTDIPLAIYGLFVSSFPEVQNVSLRCGNKNCAKSFEWNYETRSVIRLDKSDEVFLDKMAELASADPFDYTEIYDRAAVRNSKYIKLPMSGYIVEMGIASAYEFLNNFIPVLDDGNFRDAFGDDVNRVYTNNILLLTTVLSVLVPDQDNKYDKNGKPNYIRCETYKEILDAIYNISPQEIKILANLSAKFQRQYQPYFSFMNVQCPHCGHKTSEIEVTMDDLVFQTYQRLLSTEVDVTAIQTL